MTATPLRDDNRDTYLYFGNPIYEYSLRQGIDDGFLSPYRVHRVVTQWDAAGWRPSQGDIDRYGRGIPDELYGTRDFERVTADEGSIGRGHLSRFQELETTTPVILTTSQLLTTGVDAPMCRNVVLVR